MKKWGFAFLAALLLGVQALAAEPTPVEVDEDGQLIVAVTLHARTQPLRTQAFRFILDTGAEFCVFDTSVPECFFWDDGAVRQVSDINGIKAPMPLVVARKVQVGGMVRENIPALRANLKTGLLGVFQDEPVDGILGMSFLAGTRFVLDMERRHVGWGGDAWPGGVKVPMGYASGKIPTVTVRALGQEIVCRLDTGGIGGSSLPWSLRPPGPGRTSVTMGLHGPVTGKQVTLPEVGLGASAWRNVPVDFTPGVEWGIIGLDAVAAGRTCFDFVRDQLTLSHAPDTGLSYRRQPQLILPLRWDRTRAPATLSIDHVKPESPMAAAGLLAGDEVVAVGPLQGRSLTRRAIRDLVLLGKPQAWVLKRQGRQVTLLFPEAQARQQGEPGARVGPGRPAPCASGPLLPQEQRLPGYGLSAKAQS